jgi:hypothetical protein
VHPGDHDLLHEPRYLLGLPLSALHDQLIMDGTRMDSTTAF